MLDSNRLSVQFVRLPQGLGTRDLRESFHWLSQDELASYQRFRNDRRKVEYLVGRVLAKSMLEEITGVRVRGVALANGAYGKPFLPGYERQLDFSISHTTGLVVCAVAARKQVGVDVENTERDCFEVMQYAFTEAETQWVLAHLESGDKRREFNSIWTRKEASLKASGRGMAASPASCPVPLSPGVVQDARFCYWTFAPVTGYLVSVCTSRDEGAAPRLALTQSNLRELLR